ncbi:hypothetical protein STEG23_006256 [Scotinomys teguina]
MDVRLYPSAPAVGARPGAEPAGLAHLDYYHCGKFDGDSAYVGMSDGNPELLPTSQCSKYQLSPYEEELENTGDFANVRMRNRGYEVHTGLADELTQALLGHYSSEGVYRPLVFNGKRQPGTENGSVSQRLPGYG